MKKLTFFLVAMVSIATNSMQITQKKAQDITSQSGKLRWGILSTAKINTELINAIRKTKRSEVNAIASRSSIKAIQYAQEKGIKKAYGSYQELLEDPEIDIIYNSLPNALHSEWTIKAVNAGKHVLCEKPLTISLKEMDAIEYAAKANNVIVFEAFAYLHHPQTLSAKKLIKNRELGEINLITSSLHMSLCIEDENNIWLDSSLGGGSFWDLGVYPSSLAIVMSQCGMPIEVYANKVMGKTAVDTSMSVQMKFDKGIIAQISSSFLTPFKQGAEIIGTKGILTIPDPWRPGFDEKDSYMILSKLDNTTEIITTFPINPFVSEVEMMEACILDKAEPIVPLSLSRFFLKTALAIHESAITDRIITLK